MARSPLFHTDDVPEDVFPKAIVEAINDMIEWMRARRGTHIVMPPRESGHRVSSLIKVLWQCYLWRGTDLAESAELLGRQGHGLQAIMVARAIYETVASFLHFERDLQVHLDKLKEANDLMALESFVSNRMFATRHENLIAARGQAVQAISILTQMKVLAKVDPDASANYDHLSEFVHPNSMGTTLWFSYQDTERDIIYFNTEGVGSSPSLHWVLGATRTLHHLNEAYKRIEPRLADLDAFGERAMPQITGTGH